VPLGTPLECHFDDARTARPKPDPLPAVASRRGLGTREESQSFSGVNLEERSFDSFETTGPAGRRQCRGDSGSAAPWALDGAVVV
jgi:hypothetical protein